MGTYVTLACCVVVISCLLTPATSVHKKKIIVKVPHLIKHIHHTHFKPIHLHKVHTKKIEHHHDHDSHGGAPNDWKHGPKKTNKGHQKFHGSYSNLHPILLHQKVEENVDYSGEDGEISEFDQNQRVGHRMEFEHVPRQQFSQEEIFWNPEEKPAKRRSKFREESYNRGENFKRENIRLKPIDFSSWLNEDDRATGEHSGEIWGNPSEDLSNIRKKHRTPANKPLPNNKHKIKKAKHLTWRSKERGEMENGGWKPVVDFNGWRDFNDMESQHKGNYNKHFIDSGEYISGSNEDLAHSMHKEETENSRMKKRKQSRQKSKTLNKQLEDLDHDGDYEMVQKELPQHPYQLASPQSPILPQMLPMFFQPLQTHQVQPYSIPLPQTQLTQPNRPAQQQPAGSVWQTQMLGEHQPQPTPQPTITPKVVWSGHHLQMPQHSMWHVQQHSDGAPPLQMLTVNPNPLQALQFHQPHSQPQQLPQESSLVHQVVPSGWPLAHKPHDSSVKQHWEQHVQTSGSDGPASSYKVEVINYTGKKSA